MDDLLFSTFTVTVQTTRRGVQVEVCEISGQLPAHLAYSGPDLLDGIAAMLMAGSCRIEAPKGPDIVQPTLEGVLPSTFRPQPISGTAVSRSSTTHMTHAAPVAPLLRETFGWVLKRTTRTPCKGVAPGLRRFESCPIHMDDMTPETFYRYALTEPHLACRALCQFSPTQQIALSTNLYMNLLWLSYGQRTPSKRAVRKAVRCFTRHLGRKHRPEIKALAAVFNNDGSLRLSSAQGLPQLMIYIAAIICDHSDPDDTAFNEVIAQLVERTNLLPFA